MTDFNLSVSDLLLVEGFAVAFAKNNIPALHDILYRSGLDVKKEIELVKCQHRNLRNFVVTGERYEGSERLDAEWINNSGAASLEARIESIEDSNMRHTLRVMSVSRQQECVFD